MEYLVYAQKLDVNHVNPEGLDTDIMIIHLSVHRPPNESIIMTLLDGGYNLRIPLEYWVEEYYRAF
jgi:hypothetical protein